MTDREKERYVKLKIKEAMSYVDEPIQKIQEEMAARSIVEQVSAMKDDIRFNEVLGRIQSIYGTDYNSATVKYQYDLYIKKHPNDSVEIVTKNVAKRLVSGKTDRRNTTKVKLPGSIQTATMSSFIQSFIGDANHPIN